MAEKIKGITIEIGGDTSPLNKALAGINKASRGLQLELREVDKLLKFDPSNTELLAQRQEILADSVKNTSSKLDTLKEAEKQVQKQFAKGKVSEEQYRALRREAVKTEQELSELKNQAKITAKSMDDLKDSVKESGDEMKEAAENASGFGDGLAGFGGKAAAGLAAVGGAVAAAGAYAVKFDSDYDKAFNGFISKTGIAAEKSGDFEAAMQNIYRNNYGEDIGDVADAMATVAQNARLLEPANIEKMTTSALILRDTFEYDVSESIRAANMLTDQFGISSDEAFNLISRGAQLGLDKNGDLLDSINEYSVHYKQLGFTSEEFFNSLANGTAAGTFSVDKLGDAMKEFGIRVKDNSDSTKTAFSGLGLDAAKLTKQFADGGESGKEAFEEVTNALFSMDDKVKQNEIGVALFGSMWEDLGAEGVAALSDIDGEADKTKDSLNDINNVKYNDLGSALDGVKRKFETDIIQPLGNGITQLLLPAIEKIMEKFDELSKWFSEHSEDIAGAFDTIWTKTEWFRNIWIEVWNIIKQFLEDTWNAISPFLESTWNSIKAIAEAVFEGLRQYWDTWGGTIMGIFSAVFGTLSGTIKSAFQIISGIFEVFAGLFTGDWSRMWNGLTDIFSGWFNGIKAMFEGFKKIGIDLITGLWDGINEKVEWLKDQVSGLVGKIKSWFTGKDALDERSPSHWAEKVGAFLMEGLAIGIKEDTTAEEAVKIKCDNLKKFISELAGDVGREFDIAAAEYELWEARNPNADEEQKLKMKNYMLGQQLTHKKDDAEIYRQGYLAQVDLTGADSDEAREAYKLYLDAQTEYYNLKNQLGEVQNEQSEMRKTKADETARLKNEYENYKKEYAGYLRGAGLSEEYIDRFARQNTGYRGNTSITNNFYVPTVNKRIIENTQEKNINQLAVV